jgi:hypothetical protein
MQDRPKNKSRKARKNSNMQVTITCIYNTIPAECCVELPTNIFLSMTKGKSGR